MGILDSVLRGGLEDWVESEGTGLEVPKAIRSVDSVLLHPRSNFYSASDFDKRQKALDKRRTEILEKYEGLDKRILDVFKK